MTDNIVKTFLLLEGLGKHYVGQYRRRAMLYARGHEQETHTHTRIGMKRQRNRSTLFSSLSPRHQQYEYCDSWDAFMSKVIRGGSKTVTHTHSEISIAATAMYSVEDGRRTDADAGIAQN